MKGFSYSILRAACALVIGLVLVLFPDQAAQYLVITVGCVFLVPAFVSIVAHYARPAVGRRGFPLLGIGSFLFGLWLVIAPAFFADLLTYVLAFILLMGGVQQLAALSAARRWMRVPGGAYVVPVLILLAGLFALFNPLSARSTVFIFIGITCFVYALSELVNWFGYSRRRPKDTPSLRHGEVEDAEIVE